MKRVLIVGEEKCPYRHQLGNFAPECSKGFKRKMCCEKNCSLPKLPDKKELTGCADDYDNYYAGWNACLDAITGGTP